MHELNVCFFAAGENNRFKYIRKGHKPLVLIDDVPNLIKNILNFKKINGNLDFFIVCNRYNHFDIINVLDEFNLSDLTENIIVNDESQLGSVHSLHLYFRNIIKTKKQLKNTIFLESDLIYDGQVVSEIIQESLNSPNNIIFSQKSKNDDDECRIELDDDLHIKKMRKGIEGEYIFLGLSYLTEKTNEILYDIFENNDIDKTIHYDYYISDNLNILNENGVITRAHILSDSYEIIEYDNEIDLESIFKNQRILLTPGPVTTSITNKNKVTYFDLNHRDKYFREMFVDLKKEILSKMNFNENYDVVLMQGPSTFSIEMVLNLFENLDSNIYFMVNGYFGKRAKQIAERKNINISDNFENSKVIYQVHYETSNGIFADIDEYRNNKKITILDAVSSIGDPLHDFNGYDFILGSFNKQLSGYPGLSFCVFNKHLLDANSDYYKDKLQNSSKKLFNFENGYSLNMKEEYEYQYKYHCSRFTFSPQLIQINLQVLKQRNLQHYRKSLEDKKDIIKLFLNDLIKLDILDDYQYDDYQLFIKFKVEDNVLMINKIYDYCNKNNISIYNKEGYDTFRISYMGDVTDIQLAYSLVNIYNFLKKINVKI